MDNKLSSLATETVQLLKERDMTISSAESCTGGMFSNLITAVSGASEVFELGIVSYSSRIKNKILNVNKKTLDDFGAVSSQTATEMADGVRRISSSDIAVSVTGVAGPSMSEGKPVGRVYIAVSFKNSTIPKQLDIEPLSRDFVRKKACEHLFDAILETLKSQ